MFFVDDCLSVSCDFSVFTRKGELVLLLCHLVLHSSSFIPFCENNHIAHCRSNVFG